MMLASPPSCFSNIAWPSEDPTTYELNHYTYREMEASDSYVECPPSQPKSKLNHSTPTTSISSDPTMVKKLYHNASERNRRKKINNLYTTLRSLLPAADQMKTVSIPATVSRVTKYIPELQKQVDDLIRKKEDLLSRISRQRELMHQENHWQLPARSSLSAVSASWLSDTEVMVQICTYHVQKSPFTEILLTLEKDGFLLLNASSSETFEGRIFYNLHLQAGNTVSMEHDLLSTKLQSLYQKEEGYNYDNVGSIYYNDLPL